MRALADERAAEITRLAAEAARALGCGDAGLEAAETVIRAGMLKLGCGVLGELLSADLGHRGPRVPCGNGHEAELVSYRDKVIDTVLGPVTLNRAWYHCPACKHGLAPRGAELGVAGTSLSPGLTAMNDKPAAAGPFAGCKTIVGQRLKQAGMHWTTGGADAIIALRCREASSQCEAICSTPHTQTRPA